MSYYFTCWSCYCYEFLFRLALMIRAPMIPQEQQLLYCEWIMHFPDDSRVRIIGWTTKYSAYILLLTCTYKFVLLQAVGMRCEKEISLPYFWDYNLIVWFYPQVYDNFGNRIFRLLIQDMDANDLFFCTCTFIRYDFT